MSDTVSGIGALLDYAAKPAIRRPRLEGKNKRDPWRGVGLDQGPIDASRTRASRPDFTPGIRGSSRDARTAIGGNPTSSERPGQAPKPAPRAMSDDALAAEIFWTAFSLDTAGRDGMPAEDWKALPYAVRLARTEDAETRDRAKSTRLCALALEVTRRMMEAAA